MENEPKFDLQATLKQLEEDRQSGFKKTTIIVLCSIVASGLLSLYFHSSENDFLVVVSIIIGLLVAVIVPLNLMGKVKSHFKQKVMPILLNSIDPSLRYQSSGYISKDDFNLSNLYIRPDRYSGKDLVMGKVGETAVRFSLIHAEERYEVQTRDSQGRTRTEVRYRTIFKGLFFIADFNKNFSGRTFVKPKAVSFISKLFGSYVALEDPEFNKMFTVNTTDQVEARYIMTPSFMERFKVLYSKVGAFRSSFIQGNLFLAIDMPDNSFEPSMMKSLSDSAQIEKIIFNLKTITGIVEDLGLNVRIWTKC